MTFPLIALLAASCWLLRRLSNGFILWLALMLSLVAMVFASIPHEKHTTFIWWTVVPIIMPPTLAYVACRHFHWPKGLVFATFAICLSGDLVLYVHSAKFLYAQQPSPAVWGIDTTLHKPSWPQSRKISAPKWHAMADDQDLRYTELLERKAYVFSPPKITITQLPSEDPLTAAIRTPRWETMVLPRHYFSLIHSGLPGSILAKFFAIGKPSFQFKKGVFILSDQNLTHFLRNMNPQDAAHLMDCYAIVSLPLTETWNKWSMPASNASSLARACRPPRFSFAITGGINDSEVAYTAEQSGVLFWSDSYDPRWKAVLDGFPIPIARANMAFKALVIPAGSHRIRVSFNPLDFRFSLLLYYGASTLCLILAIVGWGLKR